MKGPIGVFDSGLGGLTVARAIWRQVPQEPVLYLGDTAHLPYGTKSSQRVQALSVKNVEFLQRKKVKMIVVACNTASALALDMLKHRFKLPILGVIEPGARRAALQTKNRRIGVIGTPATIRSGAYERHIRRLCPGAIIFSQACPLFVPLVEEGWTDNEVARRTARTYLGPLKKRGIDTLVLGCTHYPHLKKTLSRVMGRGVVLVDSAEETAKEVKTLLVQQGLARRPGPRAGHGFYVTDVPEAFYRQAKVFLGARVDRVHQAVIE